MMQAPNSTTQSAASAPEPKPKPEPLQDSQESVQSTASTTFSAPALPSSSSNLSTSTTAETDFTTPSSTNVASQSKPAEAAMPEESSRARAADAYPAPRIDTAVANAPRTGDTAASPMPLESPATQGFKRSADGSLKGLEPAMETPPVRTTAHKRNKSMDTHSGTRIGELSAQLKTRLSYAMVKVQNGWEKQSLEELEEGQSQRGSPNSAPGRNERLAFDSPSTLDRQRRPSGVSDISDQMLMSPNSDPARSLAATPAYWRTGTRPALNAAASLISITNPHLAPSPSLHTTTRRRRSSVSHVPPPLLSTHRKHHSDMPATPRAGILRMPSQQAEKDAVDTLLFMSSPNNSQRFPTEHHPPPQRRVMFEAYPPQERVWSAGRQEYPAYPAR